MDHGKRGAYRALGGLLSASFDVGLTACTVRLVRFAQAMTTHAVTMFGPREAQNRLHATETTADRSRMPG
jgi:hypothetical protein